MENCKYSRKDLIDRSIDSKIIPPGETIRQLMEDKKMSKAQLAALLRITPKTLDEIFTGFHPISEELAERLEENRFASKEFWMNQEVLYEEELKKEKIERISSSLFRKNEKDDRKRKNRK